ncbi:MAG: DUF547 domain-containing protein [Candidatus Kariarchaeaceae archaeon]|jgi:hypothetical protein
MVIETLPSNSVLNKYITDGKVNYDLLKQDPWITEQIEKLQFAKTTQMSEHQQLSFYLNAYNLTVIKAVLDQLAKDPHWNGVTTLWRKLRFFIASRHKIAGKKMSLYHLENKIIRKHGDPRIHFALNCASGGCPYLPGKLFSAENLEEYLESLTFDFINQQGGAYLENNVLNVSLIFKMYKSDFGGTDETVRNYVTKYWQGSEIPNNVEIQYQEYDWSLNTQDL